MRKRRAAGIGVASALVATSAGFGTMLPGAGTASEQPLVAEAPELPATKATESGNDYPLRLAARQVSGIPRHPADVPPSRVIGNATVRCDGTTTTQVKLVMKPGTGWTWNGRITRDTQKGFDKNNRWITMHSLVVIIRHGNQQQRDEFICGGDVFPKPWGPSVARISSDTDRELSRR